MDLLQSENHSLTNFLLHSIRSLWNPLFSMDIWLGRVLPTLISQREWAACWDLHSLCMNNFRYFLALLTNLNYVVELIVLKSLPVEVFSFRIMTPDDASWCHF